MSVEGTAFKWLSKNWDKITTYKNKWTVFFKHGRIRVMVFGAGGVGKTTFKDYVIEGKKALLEPVKHEESFEEECFDFGQDYWGELIVAPGQLERIKYRWPSLSKEVERGDINGIVYLCSYGYHSLRETNYKNHDLFVEGNTPTQFLKIYRQACLNAELKAFKDYLRPVLEHHKNPPWVLFLISKQDLWWTKRDEVKDYYQKKGAFHLALQEMVNKQGYENLKVEFCEVCFRAENLETKNGTVLAVTNKGYTDQERISNIQNVLKVMNDMIKAQIRIK